MGIKNKRITVSILFLLVGLTCTAQPPGTGLALPIDGGLMMGIVAAVLFGVHKIRNSRK